MLKFNSIQTLLFTLRLIQTIEFSSAMKKRIWGLYPHNTIYQLEQLIQLAVQYLTHLLFSDWITLSDISLKNVQIFMAIWSVNTKRKERSRAQRKRTKDITVVYYYINVT
jgi:hypothetical protein